MAASGIPRRFVLVHPLDPEVRSRDWGRFLLLLVPRQPEWTWIQNQQSSPWNPCVDKGKLLNTYREMFDVWSRTCLHTSQASTDMIQQTEWILVLAPRAFFDVQGYYLTAHIALVSPSDKAGAYSIFVCHFAMPSYDSVSVPRLRRLCINRRAMKGERFATLPQIFQSNLSRWVLQLLNCCNCHVVWPQASMNPFTS